MWPVSDAEDLFKRGLMKRMLKKAVVYSVALVWAMVGFSTAIFAAQNVANPSQKGSLLIFPKIDVRNDGKYKQRDTLIQISNDYPADVQIKCYWVDANQTVQDFEFRVTVSQPIWFRASDGLGTGTANKDSTINPATMPPFFDNATGELICWAVNTAGTDQVASNHLYGTAKIIDYAAHTVYEYNSFNFIVRPPGNIYGNPVPPQGDLKLTGSPGEYDAGPKYLLFNFFASNELSGGQFGLGGEAVAVIFGKTELTLVPLHQDLRQDRIPTCTKAKFDIWSENEIKYTGSYQCLKCWFQGYVSDIGTPLGAPGGFGGSRFTYEQLHTTIGRLRVSSVKSSVCNGIFPACQSQVETPLLGVMSTQVRFIDLTGDTLIGGTSFGAGAGSPAHILWDYAEPPVEASRR